MFLNNLIPQLPASLNEIIIYIAAVLGIILFIYGIFMDTEKRQDIIFMIASACLFAYAFYSGSLIFMIAMGGIFAAALVELIEIIIGIHQQDKYDLKKIVREGKMKIRKTN